MMKYLYFIAVFFAAASMLGCEKENVCKSTDLEISSLETEYGCENTTESLEVDLDDTYTIIHTQEDFERQVSGTCIPNVDFDRFDLIIGKKQVQSGVEVVEYEFERTCAGKLRLVVEIERNLATVISDVTYHVLVDKIAEGETVDVEVAVKP